MSENKFTIPLFLIATAITLVIAAVRQADWKHPALIRGFLVVATILFVAGIGWGWLADLSSVLTQIVKDVALSPVSWFVVIIVSAVSLFFKPGETQTPFRRSTSSEVRPSLADAFRTLEILPENTTNPDVHFKSKVRIVLRNDSGRTVDLLNPTWIANGDVRLDLPRQLMLQVELVEGGWLSNKWSDEMREIRVPPGWAFRTWIGLHSPLGNPDFRRIRQNREFGTLSLEIRGDGNKVKIPV
jgi:hypothetical protein